VILFPCIVHGEGRLFSAVEGGSALMDGRELRRSDQPLAEPVLIYGAGDNREASDLSGTRSMVGFDPLRILDKGGMPAGYGGTRALMEEATPKAFWLPYDTLWDAAPLVGLARSIPGMCAVDRHGDELTLDDFDGLLIADERLVDRLVPLLPQA
jgi:hypothetical protein